MRELERRAKGEDGGWKDENSRLTTLFRLWNLFRDMAEGLRMGSERERGEVLLSLLSM